MLFDGDNSVLNDMFLEYSNIADNESVELTSAKEGFLKGNMFKDEYKPYKNLTFAKIEPKDDRESKLLNVMQYEFALNDLKLYLDVNPNDSYVLKKLKEMIQELENAKLEYVKKYGPLDICDTEGDKYKWIDSPWPWEDGNKGGSIYV